MSTSELVVEAKARIIWGEDPAAVRVYLISNGMAPSDAASTVRALVAERTMELRTRGLINTCIWGSILCACVIFIVYEYYYPSKIILRATQGRAMFIVGFFGIFALWKLMNALVDLIRPKSDTRSLCDVEE